MTKLTHFNEQGRAKMVDVSQKDDTIRTAIATSSVIVNKVVYEEIVGGTNKKGDVFAVAQVAGIMAAKQTATIIPMCHPLSLTGINITFDWRMDENEEQYEALIAVSYTHLTLPTITAV